MKSTLTADVRSENRKERRHAGTGFERQRNALPRSAISLNDPCELDADAEIAAAAALVANRNTKAYQAGYADGAAFARLDGAESLFSAQTAGKADQALLHALGLEKMARILGVKQPITYATSIEITAEFRRACDEYNAGYAAGWDAEEIAALERAQ